jgi:hypothetical protein
LIPYANLESNIEYNLVITVTADNGNTGTDSITIKTSEKISKGTFIITPNEGIAFYILIEKI